MSRKLNIEPRVRSLASYLDDIEKGIVQIPAFQRDFVWSRDKIKDLFDSIKNRYPIGSILFWKPDTKIGENKKKIGAYYIPENTTNPVYILDGFQRLSTLFGCLTNPNRISLKRDKKEWDDFFALYYDLEEETFTYLRPKANPQPFQISIYMLMNSSEFRQYARKEFEKINDENKIELYYDRADKLSRVFIDYQIASTDIKNATIEEAVEIFSRINSKGEDISFDGMTNALSIQEDFVFKDEIDNLIESVKKYNFHKVGRNVIFRCIQSSFGKLYIDNTNIEELAKRSDFASVIKQAIPKIERAIKFLFEDLLVLNSKLLPYNIQLIFIMDFFKKIENPTKEQIEKLKNWFWVTTYSNYFTFYSLANQRKAYEWFHNFLDGNRDNPVYNDNPKIKFSVAQFPEKISMGSVRAKALTLFLLNYSNDFKAVDPNKTKGYTLEKLFSNNNESANIIPIINDDDHIINGDDHKIQALSFLLKDSTKYNKYFIDEKMNETYNNAFFFNNDEKKEEIIKMRKVLIQNSEKKFTERLDLEYEL